MQGAVKRLDRFQILALNTKKAHNLKKKLLEVIHMHCRLVQAAPRKIEGFDVAKVRYEDVQRSAVTAVPAGE